MVSTYEVVDLQLNHYKMIGLRFVIIFSVPDQLVVLLLYKDPYRF